MASLRPLGVAVGVLLLSSMFGALPASAYVRATTSSSASSVNLKDITRAKYGPRQPYLPGAWTVSGANTGTGTVVFRKDGTSVTLQVIPKELCGLQAIRGPALKAWGDDAYGLSKSKISLMVFGRSTYRGYSWILPDNEYHWCLQEDRRYATEAIAKNPSASLLNFLKTNLVLQLAVRTAIR